VLFPFKFSQVGPLAHWSPNVQKKIFFLCSSLVTRWLFCTSLHVHSYVDNAQVQFFL
jgi:hypothetical protein